MRLPKFALACASVAFAAGVAVVLAWWRGWLLVIRPSPDQPPEVPLTGVCLCLAAVALGVCTLRAHRRRLRQWTGRILAALLVAVGAGVLGEYVFDAGGGSAPWFYLHRWFHLELAPDDVLPSPQTAMSLLLFGLAVWFNFGRRGDRFDLADIAAAASVFAPAASLLGFVFDFAQPEPGGGSGFGMSPVGALSLAGLAAGLQSLHPRRGLASLFAAQPDGGIASRRMLMAAIVVPMLFGYAQVRAIDAGLIDLGLGVAITVAASVLIFVVLLVWNAQLVVSLHVEKSHQLAQREEQARLEAATDALTQLLNRRGWEQCLLVEEIRCQRERLDACVVAIDLDGLKEVNDQQGHAAGDRLLQRAAQALRATARRRDLVARMGGDEFAYLAAEIAPGSAPIVTERLRKALAQTGISASIGSAPRSGNGSLNAAAEIADRLMYQDKRQRKRERAAAAAELRPRSGP
jgi:diguanylate cyclase (GGDEF)-like protein